MLKVALHENKKLIIMSVELPRMSGFSVCNRFKKKNELRRIPLILVTAEASNEALQQHSSLPTRADDYLRKPVSPPQLLPLLHI